jgi:hypothetical protein
MLDLACDSVAFDLFRAFLYPRAGHVVVAEKVATAEAWTGQVLDPSSDGVVAVPCIENDLLDACEEVHYGEL